LVTGMFPLLDILCPDTKLETETEEKGYLHVLLRVY